jgi:carboxypeptidase PM20D1
VLERDVYLCFGHDEEVGGREGAARVAAELAAWGVKFEFMLDEGLMIVDRAKGRGGSGRGVVGGADW